MRHGEHTEVGNEKSGEEDVRRHKTLVQQHLAADKSGAPDRYDEHGSQMSVYGFHIFFLG